jgi:isopentenyl phosphate kinase
MAELVFLKLGGSLITDKTIPYTPRLDRLHDLAAQIAQALHTHPDLQIVLGHGSGSFGHTAAKEYGTRDGAPPPSVLRTSPTIFTENGGKPRGGYWRGFAEVWHQASALNRFVMDCLHAAGVPAIAFAPVAGVSARDGKISAWNTSPIQAALEANLLPVVYGDVIFDEARGGTILSTEDLFFHLAHDLRPSRILLAGLEAGVWADFPERTRLIGAITTASFPDLRSSVGAAVGADVTGGMSEKVRLMLALCSEIDGLEARIFSGEAESAIVRALRGEEIGTVIRK